jgi:hypothetical protein
MRLYRRIATSRGIASSLFSSAQSLGAGLFPAPFLADNSVSGPADSLFYFEDRFEFGELPGRRYDAAQLLR